MIEDCKELTVRASLLRRCCVEAHNALVRDSGYSDVGELLQALGTVVPALPNGSEEHLMLSSYTFWGSREWGGSRRGFERRLKRAVNSVLWELHENVRAAAFGAWRCVDVTDDGRWRWEAIGPARMSGGTVDVVISNSADAVICEVDEVRAGWFLEGDSSSALIFSMELAPEAVAKLIPAARKRAWYDEDAPSGPKLHVVEYERDVLAQAMAPGFSECGLEPYYYLPATLRRRFPERFRQSLVRTMVDALGSRRIPWHVRLAKAEPEWIDEFVRGRLSQWRAKARQRAQHSYERKVESESLARIIDDEECLAILGLTEEGEIDLGEFPPLKLHPVGMLNLDWQWLEERGVKSDDVIHGARQRVSDDEEDRRRLENAVERHRMRLRWCALVRAMGRREEFRVSDLSLGYDELIQSAHQVFPAIAAMQLAELLTDDGAAASRIESALTKAEYGERPLIVGDLPMRRSDLRHVRGIGRKSIEAIETSLHRSLMGWPDPLLELAPREMNDAREEIEAGLDALDDVF